MKSKTKFDPQVIQQFFVDHTEKFVIGLVAALFLFFVYQSYATVQNGYPKKPDELKTATDAALAKIANGPTKPLELLFPDYENEVESFKKPIDPIKYPMSYGLNWKQFAPLRPRVSPEVFAVEQLRAIPGRGAILKSQDDAGTLGKRWIAVTGLVPYKKQLAEYRKQFEQAAGSDPARDVPNYAGYFVQRAEVTPDTSGEPKWSKFVIFPPSDNNDATAKWGGRAAEEIADPRFVHPLLTSPLPPLADATWGSEAVSPPQIPVVPHEASQGEETPPSRVPPGRIHPLVPGHHNMPKEWRPGLPGGPGVPGGMGRLGHTSLTPPPVPGVNPGMEHRLGAPDAPAPGAEKPGAQDEEAQVPEYLLLRYFDFDVEANKQYQYRIFLVLDNPNYGLPANVLDSEKLAKFQWIGVIGPQPVTGPNGERDWPTDPTYAKWSPPVTADRLPGDMRLLGGPVAPAKGLQEISAEARVLIWLEKSGLNGSFSKSGLVRGIILNFQDAALKTPGAAKSTKVDLLPTNCILVDLGGGESLPDKERKLTSPGMILVMDESGNLVIHDEVAETEEWDKANQQPARTQPQPRDRPGPPRPRPKPRVDPGINDNDLGISPKKSHGGH